MKKFFNLLIAGTMALSLSACTGTAGGTTATATADTGSTTAEDPTTETLTIKMSWWGGDSRHEATIAALDAFMAKYPNITVETEYGAWTGWADSISTELVSGTSADVVQVNWNWLTQFSADGSKFADINNYKDYIDLTQYPEGPLADCTVGGKLQAVPVATTGRIFYWNQTTWDAAGLATPTSEAELEAAGEVFKTKLGDNYYPLYIGEYDRFLLMVFYLESKYDKPWISDKTLNYSAEEIQDGLNFITNLETLHVIPTMETINGDGADSVDKNPNWIDGHYAGLFEWDSAFTKEKGALAEGQELIVGDYFSDWGSAKGGFAKVSMGLAIAESSQHKEAAALLINFLLNDPEGVAIMATQRGIPLSAAAQETLKASDGMDTSVLEANTKVMDWVSFSFDPYSESSVLNATGTGVYQDVFGNLSYGNYSVEDATTKLMDAINEVLASN